MSCKFKLYTYGLPKLYISTTNAEFSLCLVLMSSSKNNRWIYRIRNKNYMQFSLITYFIRGQKRKKRKFMYLPSEPNSGEFILEFGRSLKNIANTTMIHALG